MKSWIYVLSQFTPEALILEGLFLLLLICGYTAFWVLRKRKYGVIDQSLPSGPVRTYLNELISQTEKLRIQLFGLNSLRDDSSSGIGKWVESLPEPSKVSYDILNDPELKKGILGASSGEEGGNRSNTQKPNSQKEVSPNQASATEKEKTTETKGSQQPENVATHSSANSSISSSSNTTPQGLGSVTLSPPADIYGGNESQKETLSRPNPTALPPSNVAAGPNPTGNDKSELDPKPNGEATVLKKKVDELESKLAEYSILENDLANIKQIQQENAALKVALAKQPHASAPLAPPLEEKSVSAPNSQNTADGKSPTQAQGKLESQNKPSESGNNAIQEAVEAPFSSPELKEYEKAEADLVSEFEKMLNK